MNIGTIHPLEWRHSTDRQWMFFTEVVDGFAQICALDVADLVDLDQYWL